MTGNPITKIFLRNQQHSVKLCMVVSSGEFFAVDDIGTSKPQMHNMRNDGTKDMIIRVFAKRPENFLRLYV
jgi:hypothetical protein